MCKPANFYLSLEERTWQEHNDIAIQNGFTLASVRNQDQADNIIDLAISSGCERLWIGGTRANPNADWTWSDGGCFDYTNWYTNEPNIWQNTNENCVEVW